MMVNLNFEQNIEQAIQLHLSPKMLAMLRMLQLSYVDVLSELEKQSEENPFVEVEKLDALAEYLRGISADRKLKKEIDFKDYPGMENLKEVSRSLQTHLLEQLKLEDVSDIKKNICELLISYIGPNGYIAEYDKVKSEIRSKLKAGEDEIDDALFMLQTFEPEGVGARDLRECLLIQIREYDFDNAELQEIIEQVVSSHLDDLAGKDHKKIAAALKITESGVAEIANFIKSNLSPTPAASYEGEEKHVIPSFIIEDGKLINLEEKYGPKIRISADYERMLKSKKTDAETVKYLKEKLMSAKDLMENFEKRGETIKRVMEMIYNDQAKFFEKGASHLRPLPQKDIASRLGVHPSTVSRAIADKFIQTQKGMFPVKFLCSRELSGHSPAQIKKMIADLVRSEPSGVKMTDDELNARLAERGVRIERRTVAGYRKELGIGAYNERVST